MPQPGSKATRGSIIATATILLIRHAAHGDVGTVLSGRSEGRPLTADGRRQAKALARKLASQRLHAVHASSVQRAIETADEIARVAGCEVEVVEALDEIDFGSWTGCSFSELQVDPAWREWNDRRSRAVPPGGEGMAAAQSRAVGHVRAAAKRFAGGTVAMVTHCDVIRAVVAAILGLSLDNVLRFDVDPASVSRVVAGEWGEKLMSLNEGTA